MTRDFKQSEANTAPNQYGLSWVLGGIAVGLLAGGVVYALMSKQQTQSATPVPTTTATQNTSSDPATTAGTTVASESDSPTLQDKPQDDTRPGFSYHAVLPQLELDVPIPPPQETAPEGLEPIVEPQQPEIEASEAAAQEEVATTVAKGRYMFQLGAYQNQAQAVQMQQRARQNGMNTRIETANINGKLWYRVRLGPTEDLQTVNIWKQRLSGMGINPMMIRL